MKSEQSVTIEINILGKKHNISIEEARRIWEELDGVFGTSKDLMPYPVPVPIINPNPFTPLPFDFPVITYSSDLHASTSGHCRNSQIEIRHS